MQLGRREPKLWPTKRRFHGHIGTKHEVDENNLHPDSKEWIPHREQITHRFTAEGKIKHNYGEDFCWQKPVELFHWISIIAIILIILASNGQSSNCFAILNNSPMQSIIECNLNHSHSTSRHSLNQGSGNSDSSADVIVEPRVVVVSSNISKRDAASNYSIPLAAEVGCPNVMRIYFSSSKGRNFVIDLIKNKRLISDKYFQISKDNINRHGRHPDASSRTLKSSNDSNSKERIVNDSNNDHDHDDSHTNHMFLNLHNFTKNDEHCHYHGYVNDNLNSISAISIVNGNLLSGFFHDGQDTYYLHANTIDSQTILSKSINLCHNQSIAINFTTLEQYDTQSFSNQATNYIRSRRAIEDKLPHPSENFILHEPFQSNSSSLFVELLVVHDHDQYIDYKRNATNIAERTMQIVNIMNAFYRQLNIFVALVGVVLWTEKNEIQLTDDGDATLTNFLKYRFEKLLPKYKHNNAQLITSTSFNGSVVGKALKGPICTHEHSGGVNTDHSHNPVLIAVTLAHELGHNLGMEHDEEDKCKCPDEKCLMSSSSTSVHPKHWSSCSINYLEESKRQGMLDCLMKRPEKAFGPICGNGFVEEGEDCDLGELLPTYRTSKSKTKCADAGDECGRQQLNLVSNPCCDRKTCKFANNATCAQGPCCDLTKCSVYNGTDTKICREKKSECDFEEICDGKSEYCPPDVHYHNGIECGPWLTNRNPLIISGKNHDETSYNFNRSRSYCFDGKCSSHETQCQLLWGSNGVVSREICYEQNVHGNSSGNCGYNRVDKTYSSCEPEDAVCGMLHCVHNQNEQLNGAGDIKKQTGKLMYGFESASVLTVSFFVMHNNARINCNGAIIDAGPNVRDPGLVPNGASCGENRMCLNQRCTHINEILYKTDWCPSDCNGNGICDNLGVCHCTDGTIGTSCYQLFSANFHLSLFLYMTFFFLPIMFIIAMTINYYKEQIKIWWFLHNRKIELKNRGRKMESENEKTRKIMSFDREKSKLTISDPIPLNQHNINRPFYDPNRNSAQQVNNSDPWSETKNQL